MSSQLLRALQVWAGQLAPGLEKRDTFRDGELELELVLKVRRAPSHEAIAKYRAAALEVLGGEKHWLVRHCGCSVERRGFFGRRQGDCKGAVVAAVVYRGHLGTQATEEFLFVCSRHRTGHPIEPRGVLAVVELPPSLLADLRKRDEVKAAEWSAKWRAEDEARERAERPVSP